MAGGEGGAFETTPKTGITVEITLNLYVESPLLKIERVETGRGVL